ncbi:LysR substrate-binding domain-containing protein [Corticibacterium sp. UT-5YL-CI-8]|nr:LysR substrate-binding domain-containing protein [Tianweitania sp. UT-5YL-CI-8]
MNVSLLQLRAFREIIAKGFSVSQAAETLHTSQSAVSKQIGMLEGNLRLRLFRRAGKRLTGLTDEGQQIARIAARILAEAESIRRVSDDFSLGKQGRFVLAATPAVAQFLLPEPVRTFRSWFPEVDLEVLVVEADQAVQALLEHEADLALVPERPVDTDKVRYHRWTQWKRSLIALEDCSLFGIDRITLQDVAEFPIIAFENKIVSLKDIFSRSGLHPKYALTTSNPEVIKAFVKMGLGVGVVAEPSFDPVRDFPIVARDVSHLVPNVTISIAVPNDLTLRGFMVRFIQLLHPDFEPIEP